MTRILTPFTDPNYQHRRPVDIYTSWKEVEIPLLYESDGLRTTKTRTVRVPDMSKVNRRLASVGGDWRESDAI